MNLAPVTLLAVQLSSNQVFVLSIMAMVFAVPVVGIIAGACRKSVTTREREQTRREVAAYVAEGSMTADEAERILRAGPAKAGAADEWNFGFSNAKPAPKNT